MAKAINFALQFTNVNDYDYILKVDDDVSLPPNFIELSLKLDADCVGGSGCAQMFKISTFMALFKGRFPEVVSDDTYCEFMIIACRKKYAKWPIEPIYHDATRKHSWIYYYEIGFNRYKLGYDPIHIFFHLRHGINYIFYLIGYFMAFIRREKKYPFARQIYRIKMEQIPKQLRDLKNKGRNFKLN